MKGIFKGAALVAAGFALGIMVAGASVSFAALSKKGWERFDPMFKQGYVAGFVEAVRIAKGVEPFSYMATQYRTPPKAKPYAWMLMIDELYKKKEHANRPMPQLIAIAGVKLESKFGEEPKADQGAALEALRTAIDKQRRALLKQKQTVQAAQNELAKDKTGDAAAPGGGAGTNGAAPADEPADGAKKGPKQKKAEEKDIGGTPGSDAAPGTDAAPGAGNGSTAH